jgi:uncharacterized membrane protein YgdD (TMEM256/DUF423 family)
MKSLTGYRRKAAVDRPTISYNHPMDRTFLLIGSVLGFLGVAFGAFGAHALKSRVSVDMLAVFETGVRYQMYHAIAVLIVATAIGNIGSARLLMISGWCFVGGVVLFSGSLYALALTGVGILGAVTPFGGLLFLAGWACLAAFALAR